VRSEKKQSLLFRKAAASRQRDQANSLSRKQQHSGTSLQRGEQQSTCYMFSKDCKSKPQLLEPHNSLRHRSSAGFAEDTDAISIGINYDDHHNRSFHALRSLLDQVALSKNEEQGVLHKITERPRRASQSHLKSVSPAFKSTI